MMRHLEHHSRLLKQVGPHARTDDVETFVKVNFDVFSESAGIIVPCCLGITCSRKINIPINSNLQNSPSDSPIASMIGELASTRFSTCVSMSEAPPTDAKYLDNKNIIR